MNIGKLICILLALGFFLESFSLNALEIQFNSQNPIYQHLDIDADGACEHSSDSFGNDLTAKVKKVFLTTNFSQLEIVSKILVSQQETPYLRNISKVFINDIFKPPI